MGSREVEAIASEDERLVFNELLKEVPIGWMVSKMTNIDDHLSFRIVAGNEIYEKIMSVDITKVAGTSLIETHPFFLDNDAILLKWKQEVCKTGESKYLPAYPVDDPIRGKCLVRTQYVSLPGNCILIMFECTEDPEAIKAERKGRREKMEMIIDKSLDAMLSDDADGGNKNTWEAIALKNLLAFGDVSETSVLVSEETNQRESVITAADIATLIQGLSEGKDGYIEQFLITFRYFISPRSLLSKIIFRYLSGSKDTRKRLEKVLRIWIREHFYDFENEMETHKILTGFIDEHAQNLRKTYDQQMTSGSAGLDHDMTEMIIAPTKRRSKLADFDPMEMAMQLTLLCFTRFKCIKPLELHSQSWSKDSKEATSPNVVALVKHFNEICSWVSFEIVSITSLKKRTNMLSFFIQVAWAALNYRDYETTFTIVLSLTQFVINRLSDTWEILGSKDRAIWEKLKEFCDHKGNYKNYRNAIRSSVNAMPYIGLYLKDLTNIDENDTVLSAGAINFYKMRKVASIISSIQSAQLSIFNFAKNLRILSYLSFEIPCHDENAIWEMSIRCEKQVDEGTTPSNWKRLSKTIQRTLNGDVFGSSQVVAKSSNPIFGMGKEFEQVSKLRQDKKRRESQSVA